MRHALRATLVTAVLAACGENTPSAPQPDTVYIAPILVEAVTGHGTQTGENGGFPGDVRLEGTTIDSHGQWALVGSTVVLHVQSPIYERVDLALVVPDTVTRDPNNSRRNYRPIVSLVRIVPTILSAHWAADLRGPTVRVELYAPRGAASVHITSVSVYWQACWNGDPYCENRITGFADRPSWDPDSGATGQVVWADLSSGWPWLDGHWASWPSALPPIGYGGPDASRAWQATLRVHIEDDAGHRGHIACSGAFIPSSERELYCSVLFDR